MKIKGVFFLVLFITFQFSCTHIIAERSQKNEKLSLITDNEMDSLNMYYKRRYDPATGLEMYDFEAEKKIKIKTSTSKDI